MKTCTVLGCTRKLDAEGVPLEPCDYQQGRCPQQHQNKPSVDWLAWLAMIFLTVIAVASTNCAG